MAQWVDAPVLKTGCYGFESHSGHQRGGLLAKAGGTERVGSQGCYRGDMSLFQADDLARAIDAKDRSYVFLRLLKNDEFRIGAAYSHGPIQESELGNFTTFRTLILAHYSALPESGRPATISDRDVDGFCNIFLSYLFTSFNYKPSPKARHVSRNGCMCCICARLTHAPDLIPKKVTNWDRHRAGVLQREALRELASSAGLALSDQQEVALMTNDALAEVLALVAYGVQLVRRCKGGRSDPSSLVLWRRFAWHKDGYPKKRFVLRAATILGAEDRFVSRIRAFSAGSTT